MVQERLGSALAKGATYQNSKKDKDSIASASHNPASTKPVGGKYGAWGPVYKNKQNFIDMHFN
jgi:hypothetical protein